MDAHISSKHTPNPEHHCEFCSEIFHQKTDLDNHLNKEHNESCSSDEWNCNDCAYQAGDALELMKHLKITGHQPSQSIKDRRKVFKDFRECYTCKMAFDGYYSLMNHRKNMHPSNKKCRNFEAGNCPHKSECWYIHENAMDVEDLSDQFKCNVCDFETKGRVNFMKHKKINHLETISKCDKFQRGQCLMSDQDCWFEHSHSNDKSPDKSKLNQHSRTSKDQVFQEDPKNAFPPDQSEKIMNMINQLFIKMEQMEKKIGGILN